MHIVVCGPVGSGKSLFSSYLARIFGVRFADTSSTIYQHLAERLGKPVSDVYAMPKQEIRPMLISLGDELCAAHGPDFLSYSLFEQGYAVVAGVRKRPELDALRAKIPGLEVVWMNRPQCGGAPMDNLSLSPDDCHHVIDNTAGVGYLAGEAFGLATTLKNKAQRNL